MAQVHMKNASPWAAVCLTVLREVSVEGETGEKTERVEKGRTKERERERPNKLHTGIRFGLILKLLSFLST